MLYHIGSGSLANKVVDVIEITGIHLILQQGQQGFKLFFICLGIIEAVTLQMAER